MDLDKIKADLELDKVKVFVYAKTALKNLFSKPATVAYPEKPAEFPERMRGHIEINAADCIGCGMCMRSCPPGAIMVNRAENTWSISRFDCVQCGSCVNMCPKKCLSIVSGYTAPGTEKRTDTVEIPEKKAVVKPVGQGGIASAGKNPVNPAGGAERRMPDRTGSDCGKTVCAEAGTQRI